MTDPTLTRTKVITMSGDNKYTKINPLEERHNDVVWLEGPTSAFEFDPGEWGWNALVPLLEIEFYNYLIKLGYCITLGDKCEKSRLFIKQEESRL